MGKGEETRAAILDAGLGIASKLGLEGLTIGTLADATGMSKSGLFAHFGSREELQLAVLEHGAQHFARQVVEPALKSKRGLPRLRAMFSHWIDWTIASGLPVGAPPGVVPQPLLGMPPFSGPQGPFAGIAAGPDGTLYISADGEGSVLALHPPENAPGT